MCSSSLLEREVFSESLPHAAHSSRYIQGREITIFYYDSFFFRRVASVPREEEEEESVFCFFVCVCSHSVCAFMSAI